MSLSTPAHSLMNHVRAGWNLGNTLDALRRDIPEGTIVPPGDAETAWGNPPVTRGLIRAVHDAGFDAVRLPVTWKQHLDHQGVIDPPWLDRVEEIVQWILQENMVCLLNVHHDAGAHGWLQATGQCEADFGPRFDAIWTQISQRFRHVGDHLVFEAFNEMLDGQEHWTETSVPGAYEQHNAWNQRFVNIVRAGGDENLTRILSVQTYSGGTSERTLDAFRCPGDAYGPGRIILQVHNYDPQGFCWRKAEGHALRDTWGTEDDLSEIDRLISSLAAFSEKHRAPVIIGEFGSEDKENTPERARHADYITRKACEHGIACFWWDCGHFAVMDRKKECVLHPSIVKALTLA